MRKNILRTYFYNIYLQSTNIDIDSNYVYSAKNKIRELDEIGVIDFLTNYQVDRAFTWRLSPQGYDFWYKFNCDYKKEVADIELKFLEEILERNKTLKNVNI